MTPTIDPGLIPPCPDLQFESSLWNNDIQFVVGIDEAGRGALAGPVAAGAVLLPPDPTCLDRLGEVRDSKQLTPVRREEVKTTLIQEVLAWGVGFSSPQEIDRYGILPAVRLAAKRALQNILPSPQHLLLDYLYLPDNPIPQTWLVKGDARSLSIASASILAKTIRDAHLVELAQTYPGYELSANKGYGTQNHRAAIHELGPTPIHRLSFAPMRNLSVHSTGNHQPRLS